MILVKRSSNVYHKENFPLAPWGKFEELDDEVERAKALKILDDRLMPYLLSETMRPQGHGQIPHGVEKSREAVVYRISITEMTGRFEKNRLGNLPQ